MWSSESLGLATWSESGSAWPVDARGGEHGIALLDSSTQTPLVSFSPVDQPQLPAVAEQYVRGDVWHLNYPQVSGRFAIRLALRPIETESKLLVLETVVSIETDLLDTHPKIDLDVPCHSIDAIVPEDRDGEDDVTGTGSAPISVAAAGAVCCSVLLGPQDRPVTTNHSTDSLLRLRLFGEFLEKGVIRRGRPWIVIDRSGATTASERLKDWLCRLDASPVPLT